MTHTHIFFYLFTCQWILCPFASSSFVFCHWVVRVLHTFWITHHYQIRDLQMFSPFLWVVFSPYWWCPLKDMKYCRGKAFKLKLFRSGPGRRPHGEAEFWKKDLKGGGGTDICCKSKRKQQVQRPWGRSLPDGLEGQKKANMFGTQQVRGKIVTQLAFPLKREPWGLKQRKDRQGLSYTSKESLLLLPQKKGGVLAGSRETSEGTAGAVPLKHDGCLDQSGWDAGRRAVQQSGHIVTAEPTTHRVQSESLFSPPGLQRCLTHCPWSPSKGTWSLLPLLPTSTFLLEKISPFFWRGGAHSLYTKYSAAVNMCFLGFGGFLLFCFFELNLSANMELFTLCPHRPLPYITWAHVCFLGGPFGLSLLPSL